MGDDARPYGPCFPVHHQTHRPLCRGASARLGRWVSERCGRMHGGEPGHGGVPASDFRDAPIRHKFLACEPLLERLDLAPHLGPWVEQVIAGGESGNAARPCDYAWLLALRAQCVAAGIAFRFKQTGANFIKDSRHYRIERRFQHAQARRAGIDFTPGRDSDAAVEFSGIL